MVSPNKDHPCHGHLAMWAGAMSAWKTGSQIYAIQDKISAPIKYSSQRKKDQIKEAVVYILEPQREQSV